MLNLQSYLENIDCMGYKNSITIKGLISSNEINEILKNEGILNKNRIVAVINFPNDYSLYSDLPSNIIYELRLPSDKDGVYGEKKWNNSYLTLHSKFISRTCKPLKYTAKIKLFNIYFKR